MEKYIEALNPKPTFNLTWYENEDLYTDGNVEDRIIELIAKNEPEDYVDAIYNNFNWPTYYHLSHIRRNILNWYPFDKESTVLEIGCGLGAITGLLCDSCKSVTAVELSKKRATSALLRCREKENLEIIVGNLNDIKFTQKFDYITLIGVLEYQGSYTDTENPYLDFLKKINGLLKPNGKLLIAIENQYGLKYWCGAQEDHVSVSFAGINQYTLTQKKCRTFSKQALDALIKDSGFKNTYFYYPMPDYKLPSVVYSEECLPTHSSIQSVSPYYVPNDSTLVANEKALYNDIIANNVFEFFANSFLVECSDVDIENHVTFASMSTDRFNEQRIITRFMSNETVEKLLAQNTQNASHLEQTYENMKSMATHGLDVLPCDYVDNKLVSPFCQDELLEDAFIKHLDEHNITDAYILLDTLYKDILKSSEEIAPEDNLMYTLDFSMDENCAKYGPVLKIGYLDMIMRNAFIKDKKFIWFDQEWILENIPAIFVLYRAIKATYDTNPRINNILPLSEVLYHFELEYMAADFDQLEILFQNAVVDTKHIAEGSALRPKNSNAIVANIKKIMNLK